MKNIALVAALAASVLAVPAVAADGSLSSSNSSSSMTVTTTIPKLVKISGLTDLSFNPTAADLSNVNGTQDATKKFCVYSNDTADGLYKIKVDGTAGSELNTGELKFGLKGPNDQLLDMGVWASDQDNNAYVVGTMAPGVERSNFKTTSGGQTRPTTLNCNGGTNASLAFRLKNSGILKVTAGSYTSVLTVTVSTL